MSNHLSRVPLALSCAVALFACSADPSAPATTPPISGASVAASSATSAAPPATSTTPPSVLPPRDVACATDADCAYDSVYLIDGRCCAGTCAPEAASRRHIHSVEATCARLGWEEVRCPMKKCAAPPPLACRAGTCVLVQ